MKTLVLLLALSLSATASIDAPMMPLQAQFCGNRIVGTAQKRFLAKQIKLEGCPEVIWVQVEDDFWLGYGVKVVPFY